MCGVWVSARAWVQREKRSLPPWDLPPYPFLAGAGSSPVQSLRNFPRSASAHRWLVLEGRRGSGEGVKGRRARGGRGGEEQEGKGEGKRKHEREGKGGWGIRLGVDDIQPAMDFISSAGADGDGSRGVWLKNTRADTHIQVFQVSLTVHCTRGIYCCVFAGSNYEGKFRN